MIVFGSESHDGNIIEGDFLKFSTHFETDAIFLFVQFSVFLFGVYTWNYVLASKGGPFFQYKLLVFHSCSCLL